MGFEGSSNVMVLVHRLQTVRVDTWTAEFTKMINLDCAWQFYLTWFFVNVFLKLLIETESYFAMKMFQAEVLFAQNYVQNYVPPPPYPGTGVISPYQDQALSPPPMPSPSPGLYSTTSPFTQDVSLNIFVTIRSS